MNGAFWSHEEVARARAMRAAGFNSRQIADDLGRSLPSVLKRLHKQDGVPALVTPEDMALVQVRRAEGALWRDIRRELGGRHTLGALKAALRIAQYPERPVIRLDPITHLAMSGAWK